MSHAEGLLNLAIFIALLLLIVLLTLPLLSA